MVRYGTCSWNYDSWVGLVYPEKKNTAAAYLADYARRYRTGEIDSWFYKVPSPLEVAEYGAAVDEDFVFTCKAPQDLTLTHSRRTPPEPNPAFLSPELYSIFLERIAPLGKRIGVVMLEFEYLNRNKMSGRGEFMDRLGSFAASIPRNIPLAIECRNGSWLDETWFRFLKDAGLSMVFSEKQYLPPVTDLYGKGARHLAGPVVLRLLGGDRAAIEKATGEQWNRIVEPKAALPALADMILRMERESNPLYVNINNHYEGSSPLTIERLRSLVEDRRAAGGGTK